MRNLWAFSFLAVFTVVQGIPLDGSCGLSIIALDFPEIYRIHNQTKYRTLCRVLFYPRTPGKTQVTISGSSLVSSQCSVEVFDSRDESSISGGEITSDDPFHRVVTSDYTGDMYLHVQGNQCGLFELTFKVNKACTGFTCDNGKCVPSDDVCNGFDNCGDGSDEDHCSPGLTGVYVGVSLGAVAFLTIVGVAAGLLYRRRRRQSGVSARLTS